MTIISAASHPARGEDRCHAAGRDAVLERADEVGAAIGSGDPRRVISALASLDAAVTAAARTWGIDVGVAQSPHTSIDPEIGAYVAAIDAGDRTELAVVLGRLRDAISVGLAVWSLP